MLTRLPGPRPMLRQVLLMAVVDGSQGFVVRRLGRGRYEMDWVAGGERHRAVPPPPGYVRRFVAVLEQLDGRRRPFGRRVARFFRRLGVAEEHGSLDFAVGPRFVVGVEYRVRWRRGYVAELDVGVGECPCLAEIARTELDLAWIGDQRA